MDNKKKKCFIFAGIVILLYLLLEIESLKKKLYITEGKNENLKYMISGYEKELKNLIYQTGKLSQKKQ